MFDTIRSTVGAFTQIRMGAWHGLGDVLLVGEGNLSFAKTLMTLPQTGETRVTATVFEKERNISDETAKNAQSILHKGGEVLYGVDAIRLDKSIARQKFDTIIFQFPNVGSRESKHGHTSNHVMIRRFLRSAALYLDEGGKVFITAVDSPHYAGAFKLNEAAAFAGYETPQCYPFDPSMFPGYSHTNTNDDESAIDDHKRFITWVFRLK